MAMALIREARREYEKYIGGLNATHNEEIISTFREEHQDFTTRQKPFLKFSISTLKKYMQHELMWAAENGPYMIIDMAFEQTRREYSNMWAQIVQGLSYNMEKKNPFHYFFTGTSWEDVQTFYENNPIEFVQTLHEDKRFDVTFSKKTPVELFPREKLVYLTPDARKPLVNFDPNKVYVMGGLVDLAGRPRETISVAREHNIECAKFPIEAFMR